MDTKHQLMNDSNMSTQYLNQADEFQINIRKIEDANKLSKVNFLENIIQILKITSTKSIVADGGNLKVAQEQNIMGPNIKMKI